MENEEFVKAQRMPSKQLIRNTISLKARKKHHWQMENKEFYNL